MITARDIDRKFVRAMMELGVLSPKDIKHLVKTMRRVFKSADKHRKMCKTT